MLKQDKTNKMSVCPAKTHQPEHPPSLIRIFTCAQWAAKDQRFLHADSEDSDQTGRMPRRDLSLRWAHTHFVGLVMSRLIFHN